MCLLVKVCSPETVYLSGGSCYTMSLKRLLEITFFLLVLVGSGLLVVGVFWGVGGMFLRFVVVVLI